MKFAPGVITGAASGKLGSMVFSHNRYGAYTRTFVIPTKSTTAAALAAKARLGNLSTAWNGLTAAQRLSWRAWAQTNPAVDRLGAQITLQANAAFIGSNTRLLQAGIAQISDPPIGTAPDALTTMSFTSDIGVGTTEVAFTPTPLGATERLWLNAYVADSEGVNYVSNFLRNITITAAAQTTLYDYQADIESVFGTLVVGQIVHIWAYNFDGATGQLSLPLRARSTVISTP